VTWGEQYVASGLTSLLIATVPLWVVLLAWIGPGGHRPQPRVFVGVGLGLLGLVLLVGPGQLGGAVHPAGALAVLLAALLWSIGTVYGNRADLPQAPLMASGVEMFSGALVLTAAGLLTGEVARVDPGAVTARSALAVLYLIVFGSLVGFTCYSWLIRNAPPAQTATYAYVNPIVAVFLGWALAGEVLTGRMLLGAAVTLAGVAVITVYRRPVKTA
jgi:drug/metabolite transporter (DMT)-like permease